MSAPVFVHDSLAEIPEDGLVDRIVTDIQWGREFFQFHGMPSGMENRQCVPLQTAPGKPKGHPSFRLWKNDQDRERVGHLPTLLK